MDDSGSTPDDGSVTGSETAGGDGGGTSPLAWILLVVGLISIGAGLFLRLGGTDSGPTTTATVVTGFEKGTSGRLASVGGSAGP